MIIDATLKSLIPALKHDEFLQLEQNIIADGCREPLLVWDDILIDGHNRYDICTKHGIRFDTKDMYFANHSDAKIWMINNQFGRRNLSDYDRVQLALELESIYREMGKVNMSIGGSNKKEGLTNSSNLPPQINTRKEIAKIAGVSEDTVGKVKKINEIATPEIKKDLAEGNISINAAHNIITGKVKKELPQESFDADDAELKASEAAYQANLDSLQKIAESDDKLAAALLEIKQLQAELAAVKISRDGYMNKSNEAIATIKSLQKRIDKLEK
jgi:uncharacterized small protein (DUF1192 family)